MNKKLDMNEGKRMMMGRNATSDNESGRKMGGKWKENGKTQMVKNRALF